METPEEQLALAGAQDAGGAAAEASFLEAKAGFYFRGALLNSYTPSRKVACQAAGMIYPFVPESGEAAFNATGMYPGQLRDIILVLFACNLKNASDLTLEEVKAGAWTPTRMLGKPQEAWEVALEWAGDLADMTSQEFREGRQLFMAIVQNVDANEFRLEVEGELAGTGEPEPSLEDDAKKV